mgnify:CR=1 FL=1
MRILLYGSTPLTERVARAIRRGGYELVGYVPSVNPWLKGRMDLVAEKVEPTVAHDIGLSVQYDRILPVDGRTFNLHSGLIPEWGGCDILYHTLKEGATEQGLTFHRITDTLDRGPVVARVEYPVLPGDDVIALYDRMMALAPNFVLWALWLVDKCGVDAEYPDSGEPTIYRRGKIDPADREQYERDGAALRRIYE